MTTLFSRPILAGLAVCFFASGCLDPRFTRLPQWYARHPVAENAAFELTDPFPDPDLAPDTFARPRGYTTPRTEPRRAAEQRLLNDMLKHPESIAPYRYPGARQYSKSVH